MINRGARLIRQHDDPCSYSRLSPDISLMSKLINRMIILIPNACLITAIMR